ncbi:MAG: arsenic resistance N-acetyltransferase ArsN2, partial [Chloroflexi bacterium]|nr:arsenic resistance N-acetyltransferase ArsN2 [Chloroflexota bacterium]
MLNVNVIIIEPAAPADLTSLLELLHQSRLPLDGFSDHLATALVARDGQAIVGSAALELYGRSALLRSVAVAESRRGRGLGHQLTQAALALARQRGASHVYLLTETAAGFFPRFGFQPIDRAHVPAAVQQSLEFT